MTMSPDERQIKFSVLPQKRSSTEPIRPVIKAVNWVGVWTLYCREVLRFISVAGQTIVAPLVTIFLFSVVFSLALGGDDRSVDGVDYVVFLAPGLVMMAMIQNAFSNTSSSLMISKVQGNIVDILMAPLEAREITVALALGGVTRSVFVGFSASVMLVFLIDIQVCDLFAVLWFAFHASLLLALAGMIGGIWAQKYDHLSAVTNFVITPLSFLSGTFYGTDRLPDSWQFIAQFNPFFYMIDGFRYGFIGHAEGDVMIGALVLPLLNLIVGGVVIRLLAVGYRIKS